ncbi:MAG: exopolysaccharide biosynthesis protein [Desulfarculus sp.]|nr:MAG: exopolysaccharide biosynthesis protein [Desulfarculus sp.]
MPPGQPSQAYQAPAPGASLPPPAATQAPPPRQSTYVPPPAPFSVSPYAAYDEERLVSLYQPGSPEAKRIDILRSQLLYPFHGEPPRTIMIASATAGEGRSLLTTNLAISFARGLQQYVLIMDCHLGHPVIHELLGVPQVPGLSDFLERGAAVPDIIHWSKVEKLAVIPAGSPSARSAEILATDRMAGLIRELRERYADRYILLDTPPVQRQDDPAVLARMVEGIVFVVLGGVTDRELVLRALHSMPEEKIVGVVLNDKKTVVVDTPSLAGLQARAEV